MVPLIVAILLAADVDEMPWLPPEDDYKRFPSGDEARAQVLLYRQHMLWVEWMATQPCLDARYGRDYWQAMKARTLERMDCWELLAWVNGEGEIRRRWGIPRRIYLGDLRDRLGDGNYNAARMPPRLCGKSVPVVPKVVERKAGNQ